MKEFIDALEGQFDALRREDEKLSLLCRVRGIDDGSLYNKKSTHLINLYFPNLTKQCKDLIENTAHYTDLYGYKPEVDFMKDGAWAILGKCVGESL